MSLMGELYSVVGPQPFMVMRLVLFSIAFLNLMFAFLPTAHGKGPYRQVRYFHPGRLVSAVIFCAFAIVFAWIESKFGHGYRAM